MHWSRARLCLLLAASLTLVACSSHESRPKADPCLGNCNDIFDGGPYEVPGATRGGTITVLTHDGLVGTLDPAGSDAPDVVSLLSGLVTRSLTQWSYDPESRQMVLVPDLATDLGLHNEDYTIWKFALRKGARFEDGSRVTADDVARGVRRCLHEHTHATSPCRAGGALSTVSARRNVLTFRFDRPFPDLPYLASTPAIGPVPAGTSFEHGAYARHPVATGPYRVERYRPGHDLVLVRNPEWDPATDSARTQYPDRYVVRSGVAVRRIQKLMLTDAGPAQTTLTYDTVDTEPFYASSASKKRLVLGARPCTTYWAPDNRVLTSPVVRQALADAFPYRAAIRAEGLVAGITAIPATNLLPPTMPGRTSYRLPWRHGFGTYPARARRLLARAHALGTEIRFSYAPHDHGSVQIRNALTRSLRASGFTPRPVPHGHAGEVDVLTRTWCGAWPTGRAWLPALYGSGRPTNVERFSRPAVDHAMRTIDALPLDEQAQAWNRLDRRVMTTSTPLVPLWYGGVSMAHGSRIQGMHDDQVSGMPTWQQLWVSS